MKQLLILSGKGGTGKTTVAGAFIKLAQAKAYADCDVDAPNLHLALAHSSEPQRSECFGLPKAEIDPKTCLRCGRCWQNCRFDAILQEPDVRVDPFACEGCGVCSMVCPAGAVSMKPAPSGELALYRDGGTVFSTAKLHAGSGATGKLVTEVKWQLLVAAGGADLVIIDGSPGIGCPVIASMSGVDMVLVVTEPSISGMSDLARVLRTARIFGVKAAVCINKHDTNPSLANQVEALCSREGVPFAGRIPFDPEAVRAINRGQTVADTDCPSGRAVRAVYAKTIEILMEGNREGAK